MTLAASGTIAASDLRTEFVGGSSAIDMASYYRGANTNVKSNASNNTATNLSAGVPTSGAISFSDFYSQAKGWKKTFSSNSTQQSGTSIFGDDYAVDYPKFIVINADVTVYSTSTSAAAIDIASGGAGSITVTNSGNIYGMGGASGQGGGTALAAAVSTTVVNNSGANIKGGGGGGGTGGAGGKGVVSVNATLSEFVDEGGAPYDGPTNYGGSNGPSNDAPSWFDAGTTPGYGGNNNLNGKGAVENRLWGGINNSHPQSGSVNVSWGFFTTSTNFSGSLANRGPFYCSFKVSVSGSYTLTSATLSSTYGSGYGSPVINISTSNSSAGTNLVGGQSLNLTANTTYYLVGSLSNISGTTNLYYNNFDFSFSLGTNDITSGGAAGAGGVGQGGAQSATGGSSGSSGGSNAGTGGTGGAGGALGAAGSNGSVGGNGSGTAISFPSTAPTNGATASSGGAAGFYIYGNSNVSLTQNGTVAGNVA
jgi:hypothetical protein